MEKSKKIFREGFQAIRLCGNRSQGETQWASSHSRRIKRIFSADVGYQFKSFCDKCGNGYMSTFIQSKVKTAASLLRGAGQLLGGIFGSASANSYEIQRVVGARNTIPHFATRLRRRARTSNSARVADCGSIRKTVGTRIADCAKRALPTAMRSGLRRRRRL